MERKAGLGFGFFYKNKAKSRKKSERQLAEMVDKIAIRGSIQHIWGEEPAPAAPEPLSPIASPTTEEETGLNTRQANVAPPVSSVMDISSMEEQSLEPLPESFRLAAPLPPLKDTEQIMAHEAGNDPAIQVLPDMEEQSRVDTPSQRSLSNGSLHPPLVIYKRFSFCPSTTSLVSSPPFNLRSPRSQSLTRSNYPYSRRSDAFSSSTPDIRPPRSFVSCDSRRPSETISIADDEIDFGGRINLSPTNSLTYSTSIISHLSSTADTTSGKHDDAFLPGQIYAPSLPNALRGLGCINSLPEQYDEEDDDDDSLDGLSEVNANSSDLDFEEEEVDLEQHGNDGNMQLTTGVNETLRRDSIKRISYTKLDNGDYLVERQHRSHQPPGRRESVRSDRSDWSTVHREYIAGDVI